MRALFILLVAFMVVGCEQKLTKRVVADMVVDYFMPYSSTEILVPQSVDVLWIKKEKNRANAKVCYTFRFLTSYQSLVDYIKAHPNSNLARFDVGLVALLGRKFGNFRRNEIKSRCDIASFERIKGKWVLRSL